MPQSQPAWFCIRSHQKHEHIAAAHLRQLSGVDVFNPQLRLLRSTRRGSVCSVEPLFPNYLFGRFVLETMLEKVRYTPSVKTVLAFGGRVPEIPDFVIEELRRSLMENESVIFTDAPLTGDEVEVASGPFEGARGAVTRVLPAKRRVEILLEVMGQAVPAQLSLDCLLFRKREAVSIALDPARPPRLLGDPKPLLNREWAVRPSGKAAAPQSMAAARGRSSSPGFEIPPPRPAQADRSISLAG